MSADKDHDEAPSSPDIHFEPVVTLTKVDTKTFEENEEELVKLRAKLFRYIIGQHDTTPEWKERGVGDVKILKDKKKHVYRLVMRREKTHKVCANHYLSKEMELKPNCGSDRAWVWSVSADFADEEPQKETLAIRFANSEFAKKFKDVFDTCKEKAGTETNESDESDKLAGELESLKVNGSEDTTSNEQPKGEQENTEESEETVDNTQETSDKPVVDTEPTTEAKDQNKTEADDTTPSQ